MTSFFIQKIGFKFKLNYLAQGNSKIKLIRTYLEE